MDMILTILPVAILAGMAYLLVITLREAFKLEGTEQIAWVFLILFTFPLGPIIFLLVRPGSKKS